MATGKGQPAPKTSNLPGSFKGNAEGSGASPMAESKLPGSFISMEAGANPEGPDMLGNGPLATEPHTQIESGAGGLPNRKVTGRCESPYSV